MLRYTLLCFVTLCHVTTLIQYFGKFFVFFGILLDVEVYLVLMDVLMLLVDNMVFEYFRSVSPFLSLTLCV